MKNRIGTLFFLLGATSMIVLSTHYFMHEVTGILSGKDVASNLWYRTILRVHIIGGMISIAIGPFQFISGIRSTYPKLHRQLGYIYFAAVLIGGLSGLIAAQFAMGGIVSTIGFSTLAALWMITSILAVRGAIKGNIKAHRFWMYINYGLTFSAIPQRTMLALALVTEIPFLTIYQYSAWCSWIFNIIMAYGLFHLHFRKYKFQKI